ncbi:MAG: RNA 2',3'-cyclic phosphodiesterase [Planctomycetota bacterium]|nr:RNA 2',3'-cyclic phosphodiesterase [Planctomycetota bacterium]
MRLFIVVSLEESVRKTLGTIQKTIKGYFPGIKLVENHNIHLTVRFLGEVTEERLPEIFEVMSVANKYPSFELYLKGIGAFPSVKNPRVVWVSCETTSPTLFPIYQEIESGLKDIGFSPDDHNFSAHITLGRNKASYLSQDFLTLVQSYSSKEIAKQQVKSITLFQSTLTPSGPIYKNIRDFGLKECY